MSKGGLAVLLVSVAFIVLLAGFSVAANETASESKAYSCLEDQISARGNLSLKEATFGVLAIGDKSSMISKIEAQKDAKSCWPKGACTIKESAQVALAYDRVGKDSSEVKSWLLSKNASATELKWFIEIDIPNRLFANCTIKDGQRANNIKISSDMSLSGNAGSCLSIENNGFMLRVNNNCLKNTFDISCDQDFITAVNYQRTTGGITYVLPESHSAASLGTTSEKINSECLKTGSTCDYEGTLWGALVLQKMGEDVSRFTPYLLALADDNLRYFPSAFLYIIVGGDDQYNLIVQDQKQGKFWEVPGTRDGRYYDTSVAMLALSSKGGGELDSAKEYLLSIQTKEGCWNSNNIRDTAFLLYSGWSKSVGTSTGGTTIPSCEPQFSCENVFDCQSSGGTIERSYACPNAGQSCCSAAVREQTCTVLGGKVCNVLTEQCQGIEEPSLEGSCCTGGECIEIQQPEDTCAPAGGTCKALCESNEQESYGSCLTTGEVCCMKKGGSKLWLWIVILLILIALVVFGIIYRAKVKIWWFKFMEWFKAKILRKKAGLGAPTKAAAPAARPMPQRPGAPFAPFARPMMPVRPVAQPARFQPKPKDKEMEEALRKLREMSKK